MPTTKRFELRFPSAGVGRRKGYWDSVIAGPPYQAPWAVNVRTDDPLSLRQRGGSRPGLTRLLDDPVGSDIAAIESVATMIGGIASRALAVVVDGQLGVVSGGSVAFPVGDLVTEAGVALHTEAGVSILANTAGVPEQCRLCVRGQVVYAVASGAIVSVDLSTGVVGSLQATRGSLPTGASTGVVWRDRLVLFGGDNAIYLSRQGDFADWDFGADVEDSGRAMVFQLAESSEIGDRVTAVVPFHDQTLLAATANSLWAVVGDPSNGSLRCVSRGVGMIGARAWCRVDDAQAGDSLVRYGIVFLSSAGLFIASPDGGSVMELSGDRIPDELRGVSASADVSMVYSSTERGIYLFVESVGGDTSDWFFDLVHRAFWPVSLPVDARPVDLCEHSGSVLLACADGVLRTVGGSDDDGTSIVSHVLLGPLHVTSGMDSRGVMNTIEGAVGESSAAVTWRIVAGTTAESACERARAAIEAFDAGGDYGQYVKASGVFHASAGRTRQWPVRVNGPWFVVWLQSSGPWAYEWCCLEGEAGGRYR